MFNVRLAGDHLYGKRLFIRLSLVMTLMVYYSVFFSHEMSWMRSGTEYSHSLSENFPTYSAEATHITDSNIVL